MPAFVRVLAGLVVSLASSACSSSSSSRTVPCQPLETGLCDGPAGCIGHRTCGADSSWGECACGNGAGGESGTGGGMSVGGAGSGTGGGSAGTGGSSVAGGGGTSNGGSAGGVSECPTLGLHGPALAYIPAGSTEIGSLDIPEAQPLHEATFNGFCFDETEVTVAQYRECHDVDAGCSDPMLVATTQYPNCNFELPGVANQPINCISFEQAQAYCAWAGKRLPSEEEWEYAARGSQARTFPWGDEDPAFASFANWNSSAPSEVGTFPLGTTAEGVADLAGNVWEYTSSFICPRYDSPPEDCSPTIHVTRGGSWASAMPQYLQSAFRNYETEVDARMGIRCAY